MFGLCPYFLDAGSSKIQTNKLDPVNNFASCFEFDVYDIRDLNNADDDLMILP